MTHPQPPSDGAGRADLLPCPFCGTKAERYTTCRGKVWGVGCFDAHCGTYQESVHSREEADERWNRRSRPAPPAAEPTCPRCGGNVVCENTDCGWDAAKETPASAAEQDTQVERDAVYAWLGFWRDKMPPEAVTSLQNILGPL